jgi:hypothetical protein
VRAVDNRAVFEIPEILEALISHHRNLRLGRYSAAQFALQMQHGR